MKRIFLTLGLLLFAGGSYYIGENYTLVQLSPEQIAQMNTTGIQSSVLVSGSETSEGSLVFHFGSFALVRR